MNRFAVVLGLVATLVVGGAGSALGQSVVEQAISGVENGLYVAPGAEEVDRALVERSIATASNYSVDLLVVVLATDDDAVAVAEEVRAQLPGTVLVFTPSAYGASSGDLSQGDLDAALDAAHGDLSGPDVAAGVEAFVEAADPAGVNWFLVGLGVVILLGVVAVAGRLWEKRASTDRRDDALDREWQSLRDKAGELADPVIELSTLVQLADDPEATAQYQTAATAYGDVRDRLDREASGTDVESLRSELSSIESSLEKVLTMVTGDTPS